MKRTVLLLLFVASIPQFSHAAAEDRPPAYTKTTPFAEQLAAYKCGGPVPAMFAKSNFYENDIGIPVYEGEHTALTSRYVSLILPVAIARADHETIGCLAAVADKCNLKFGNDGPRSTGIFHRAYKDLKKLMQEALDREVSGYQLPDAVSSEAYGAAFSAVDDLSEQFRMHQIKTAQERRGDLPVLISFS